MGKAVDFVEQVMLEKNNYKNLGLVFPEKARRWKEFNMLVGENGSGKSRMLQMIKENVNPDCITFYMDFVDHKPPENRSDGDASNAEETQLVDKLIFREEDGNKVFKEFLGYLNNQIVEIFNELSVCENSDINTVKKRAAKILREINPIIDDILHREISVKENAIYLRKGKREVTIQEEWSLLSPGERNILLVIFCVLFIKMQDKPCVLLIDELETHLHPDAQVKLYKLLKQTLKDRGTDCCTCIASHSIFLLPLFSITEIVYMNNGEIGQINGGLYQQVYDNLTGEGDMQEESLTNFLYSMSAWQYADYLAQCFLAPITVDKVTKDDEQALQFVEALKNILDTNEKIEVLDFGAGSARIGRCMELMIRDDKDLEALKGKIRYHIYDPYKISDEFTANTDWRGNAYRSEKEISSHEIHFDMILLYNVLHEIGIDEWAKELGFIFNLLVKDGILVFGEREVLSIGEKPYGKSGYLVLGKEELSKLFPQSQIQEIVLPKKLKPVTRCFTVKKRTAHKGYPSEKNVKEAMQLLKDNTKDKIRNRHKNGLGERGNSRKYAFYCQQYINAEEAIEILEEMRSSKMESTSSGTEDTNENQWWNDNTTLEDILCAYLTQEEKIRKIRQLSIQDTAEGIKCKKYLADHGIIAPGNTKE